MQPSCSGDPTATRISALIIIYTPMVYSMAVGVQLHGMHNSKLRVVWFRSFFVALTPVQEEVLQVCNTRHDEGHGDKDKNGSPALGIVWSVTLPEQLASDDASEVG